MTFDIGDRIIARHAPEIRVEGEYRGWGIKDDGERYILVIDRAGIEHIFPIEGAGWVFSSPTEPQPIFLAKTLAPGTHVVASHDLSGRMVEGNVKWTGFGGFGSWVEIITSGGNIERIYLDDHGWTVS